MQSALDQPETEKSIIRLYNREIRSVEEEVVYKEGFKNYFYGTKFGRIFIRIIFKRRWFSRFYGYFARRPKSKAKIPLFIQKFNINTDEIEQPLSTFHSINDFFIRTLKPETRPINTDPNALIAIADSRLWVTSIKKGMILPIKGKMIPLAQLVNDKDLILPFENGMCLIFRLVPADCHRFFYIDDAIAGPIQSVGGDLHASAPADLIMPKFPALHGNYRQNCAMRTKCFGDVIHIDIGAMTVGSIIQHRMSGGECYRGEEKGYFEFGGSTIVVLLKSHVVTMDEDIVEYSRRGIETRVRYGSAIGRKVG